MLNQDPFSPREKDVFQLLAQGKSNKQIALALGISVRTVEFHLSHIYARLGVASRTEAVLKWSEPDLRESTALSVGAELRESAVDDSGKLRENGSNPFWRRKYPLKNLLYFVSGLLLTTIMVVTLLFVNHTGESPQIAVVLTATSTPIIIAVAPSTTPVPILSAREKILNEMQTLIDAYNQQVALEKENGTVAGSLDPVTDEELFQFSGESYEKIAKLYETLNEQLKPLEEQYIEVYRREVQPTPFPTQASAEENEAYYDLLVAQYPGIYEQELANGTFILVYDPDQGKYQGRLVGDAYARIEIAGQAFEELRNSPTLAEVDREADIAQIRAVVGDLDLQVSFQRISGLANGPFEAAVYEDADGTRYWVEVETGRLAQIEPTQHEVVPAFEGKSIEELRTIAEQFAYANSPSFAELKPVLWYEENGKGSIYTFRWDYRIRDWSGTTWAMMPPLLQVGVLANGEIETYINTLDLWGEE
jgi:DNA-binding CsgD family transcriptional regulator